MLRVLVFALAALGVADAGRPLGGSPTPAPTSVPTMVPSWDCISRFYSRMGLNSTNITCTTL